MTKKEERKVASMAVLADGGIEIETIPFSYWPLLKICHGKKLCEEKYSTVVFTFAVFVKCIYVRSFPQLS